MKQLFPFLVIFILLFSVPATGYSQIITTIAGDGTGSFAGDGSPATGAELNEPSAIGINGNGDIYIADRLNNRIRKINSLGIISTIAGNGISGYAGDGGPATAAALYQPMSATADYLGNIYITFYFQHYIRKISTTGTITTIAGSTVAGFSGDGGPASAASLNTPWAIAVDRANNIFFTDQWNHRIRKISTSGIITTVAGSSEGYCGDGIPATLACLYCPNGIAVDGAGNLYIGDAFNCRIRKVNTSGIITTIAGNGTIGSSGDGGPATAALVNVVGSLTVDGSGNLFIADYGNNKIREINTAGIITTIAGTGVSGFSGDGGPATAAEMGNPFCVTVDSFDNLYIADLDFNRVRKVSSGICIGSSVALSNGVSGGTWSSSNSSIASVGSGTGIVTGVAAGTATVTYVVGLSSSLYAITVYADPVAGTILGPDSVCVGSSVVLAGTVTGGAWGRSNTNANILPGMLAGILPGIDSIFYTVTNSCGTASAYKVFHIVPRPAAGTISGRDSVCVGAAIMLTDTLPGGIWSSANGNAAVAGSVVTGVSAGVDTIFYSIGNVCGTDTASRVVTISPLPFAGTIIGADSLCPGHVVTLSDGVTTGVWTASNGNAAVSGGLVTGIAAGADTIIYSVTNSCGTDTASHMVTVNPSPDAGSISGLSVVCTGATTPLADTAAGGTWGSSNGNATISGTGLLGGVTAGIDTIYYAVTNSCGAATAMYVVTVSPNPDAGIITGRDSLCIDSVITLLDTAAGGTWASSDPTILTVTTGMATGHMLGADTVFYTVSNTCGTAISTKVVFVTNDCLPLETTELGRQHFLNLYPDPATAELNISSDTNITNVVILNLLGQTVFNNTYNAKDILVNVSTLPAGTYIIKINDSQVRKFEKE